jgi:hypothetical protein
LDHEAKDGTHHVGQVLGQMVGPLFVLVVLPVDFFFSDSSISYKNDVAKKLGPFNVRKVPKSQNMQKQ